MPQSPSEKKCTFFCSFMLAPQKERKRKRIKKKKNIENLQLSIETVQRASAFTYVCAFDSLK